MGRLSWFALSIAMLTLAIVPLTTRTNILAEGWEKTKAEEREWGKDVNGCRISIALKDYDEKGYGPVTLSIIVKNTGKGTVMYVEPSLFYDYGLTIEDAKGEEVSLTRYGKHIRHSIWNYERAVVELAPGKQKEYTLVVSRFYDLTLPGTYTIAAALKIHDAENEKWLPVTSNTITVKVPD